MKFLDETNNWKAVEKLSSLSVSDVFDSSRYVFDSSENQHVIKEIKK